MKRGLVSLGLLVLVVSLFSLSGVFAQSGPVQDINNFIDGVVNIFNPITQYIVGDSPGGEYLFAKILLLLVVFAITWTVLSRIEFFNENTWVVVVVSIAVSILSIRFLDSQGTISAILLPYSTLGIALSAGLPFVIYFLIVNKGFGGPGYNLVRRLAWILFASIFIVLWFTRYDDLDNMGRAIYLLTFAGAIVIMFMDGTINKFFTQLKVEKAGVQNTEELETELLRKINQTKGDLKDGIITPQEMNKRMKRYTKQIAALHK